MTENSTGGTFHKPTLKRSLTTTHMVLYGLGVTVGAGIYVLIGQGAGRAGLYTPVSFVLAAVVMAFSAASFAELSTRYPVSAGEAAYVEAGFGSKLFSTLVGLCVIAVGLSSAATVSVGVSGYILEFLNLSPTIVIILLVVALGLISVWGITESVSLAALFAIVEVGGLLAIIAGGFLSEQSLLQELPKVIPGSFDPVIWSGIGAAGLLAFFAFIGFEDMVNVAEEVKAPERTLPLSIFLTLVISTAIYFLVASIAVLSGPIEELASSSAPLAVVVERLGIFPASTLSLIAIIAGLNGIIVQIVMVARVLYGLADSGKLPSLFSKINARTRTPHIATGAATLVVLLLALTFPIETLAEFTSRLTLAVFAAVNAALLSVKLRNISTPAGAYEVWTIIPAIGFVLCLGVLIASLL